MKLNILKKFSGADAAKILVLFFLCLFFDQSAAQNSNEFSLEQAKEYALIHSKEIALKQVEINKAKYQVKESLSYLLPQIDGELAYTHYGKLNSTIIPEGTFFDLPEQVIQFGLPENIMAGVTATQPIFNGVFLVGFKAADIFVKMTQQEKVVKEDELKDMITRSYYNVLVTRETVSTVEKNIKNIQELYNQTKNLFENGLVEEIDVDRLALSLANLKTKINSLSNNAKLTEIVLKFQMGYPIDEDIVLTQSLSDFVGEEMDIYPAEGNFESRNELHLMNLREQVNLANIKRLKFTNLPYLTAFASLATSAQRSKFDFLRFGDKHPWFNYRYFGVQLNVPIWDSFGRRAKVQSAREDLERIRLGRDLMQESFKLEYSKANIDYANALNEYHETLGNIKLAEKIYETAQLKYKEGVGSSLELTTAEQELYNTQALLISAKHKILIARTDIEKALGQN